MSNHPSPVPAIKVRMVGDRLAKNEWHAYRKPALKMLNKGVNSYRAIADALGTNASVIRRCALADGWRTDRNKHAHIQQGKLWKKYRTVCKEYHFKGLTKRAIADLVGIPKRWVLKCARKDQWPSVIWCTPRELPKCPITNFRTYSHRVRHWTEVVYQQYQAVLDPKGLRGVGFHLDHRLSVYHAFHALEEPVPYQLIAHPANLELLAEEKNYNKGKSSSLTYSELLSRVEAFEATHGKVFLPISTKGADIEYKYTKARTSSETTTLRISQASKVTTKDLKRLAKLDKYEVPKRANREHLTREGYEYICFHLLHGMTQKAISTNLGLSQEALHTAILRMGLIPGVTNTGRGTSHRRSLVTRLKSLKANGLSPKEVSRKLGLTVLQTMFVHLRLKGFVV